MYIIKEKCSDIIGYKLELIHVEQQKPQYLPLKYFLLSKQQQILHCVFWPLGVTHVKHVLLAYAHNFILFLVIIPLLFLNQLHWNYKCFSCFSHRTINMYTTVCFCYAAVLFIHWEIAVLMGYCWKCWVLNWITPFFFFFFLLYKRRILI